MTILNNDVSVISPDRIIVSGKFIELYKYQYPPDYVSKYKHKKKKIKIAINYDLFGGYDKFLKKRSEDSLRRARQTVRRIIDCNADSMIKFNTLTYGSDVQDLDESHLNFRNFIDRLKYFIDNNSLYGHLSVQDKITKKVTFLNQYEVAGCHSSKDFKYICAVEFMPSGRVHYHFLSNCKFISNYTPVGAKSVFAGLWANGFVKTNQIYATDSLGAYVSKYLYKAFSDFRLNGRKAYFTSRGLIRPQVMGTGFRSCFSIVQSEVGIDTAKLLYKNEWTTQYQGKVQYQKYLCQ